MERYRDHKPKYLITLPTEAAGEAYIFFTDRGDVVSSPRAGNSPSPKEAILVVETELGSTELSDFFTRIWKVDASIKEFIGGL